MNSGWVLPEKECLTGWDTANRQSNITNIVNVTSYKRGTYIYFTRQMGRQSSKLYVLAEANYRMTYHATLIVKNKTGHTR
jgi:hypothetical protein